MFVGVSHIQCSRLWWRNILTGWSEAIIKARKPTWSKYWGFCEMGNHNKPSSSAWHMMMVIVLKILHKVLIPTAPCQASTEEWRRKKKRNSSCTKDVICWMSHDMCTVIVYSTEWPCPGYHEEMSAHVLASVDCWQDFPCYLFLLKIYNFEMWQRQFLFVLGFFWNKQHLA